MYYDNALNLVGILVYEGRRATLFDYTIPNDKIEDTVSISCTIILGFQYSIIYL